MYRKLFIGTIMLLVIVILPCFQPYQVHKEFGDLLPVSQKDIKEIKLWGTRNGKWEDGRLLNKEESISIIEWVNSVKSLVTITLPPEMKAPHVLITIYLLNGKIIQLFP